ncbi:MAG: hypothetical protein EF813_00985 [Methanosarcinales archaeon]|nr:MAG: hypothetical protein EF813_00985 [Methanosarcinales archaeon]
MKDTRDCYNLLVGRLPSTTENSRTRFFDYPAHKVFKSSGERGWTRELTHAKTTGYDKRNEQKTPEMGDCRMDSWNID